MPRFIPIEAQLQKEGFVLVAGIDEAGRGPMAGPVVSAAVILKQGARLPGLNDSKKLSPRKREELFEKIVKNSLDFTISIVSPQTIDKINILESVKLANYLCIQDLKYKPDIAVIDGRDKQILKIPFKTIIKGDQKVRSIAAASILAKVTRDKLMAYYAKKYPNYGFERHMGYGTREHRSNMTKFGLSCIHRKSYSYKR
jgi:ribonuclease HII